MAKILVTGGAGFIGSHLTDRLIRLGYDVTVLDNLSYGNKYFVNKRAKFVLADVRDDLSKIFQEGKFDYVFHLAAQVDVRKSLENPKEDEEINYNGSVNVAMNCVKYNVKKLIFSSTGGAIYSPDAELPCDENSKAEPLSQYGKSKLKVEQFLQKTKKDGLNYAILRYSNVYGPRQNLKGESGVISIFIKNIIEGKDLVIFGDGKQTRDFVYVDDVVNANLIAIEKLSGIYNVSTGKETSINDLADMMGKIMKSDCKIINKMAIKGELLRSVLDSSKLMKKGWKPNYNLNEGLKNTINWFKENY